MTQNEWLVAILAFGVGGIAGLGYMAFQLRGLSKSSRIMRQLVDTERRYVRDNLNWLLTYHEFPDKGLKLALIKWRDSVGVWVGRDPAVVIKDLEAKTKEPIDFDALLQ